jgi:hypothetical protein
MLGLISGAYSLHGGVVRDMGGRIVAHLATPAMGLGMAPGLGWVADAFQTYQLHELGLQVADVQKKLETVLSLTMATLTVSGLGLAVSLATLGIMSHKLGQVKAALDRIERSAKKTNNFLQAMSYGQLHAAFDGLALSSTAPQAQTRHDALVLARRDFGQLVHQYDHLWPRVETPEELAVLNDAYVLAMVGHSLALSELKSHDAALVEFARHRAQWRGHARDWCDSKVLKDDPHRLLHHRYLSTLPLAELIRLVDFARGEAKGVVRLDELRKGEADASVFRLPQRDEEAELMALARQMLAKDELLESYEAHFAFLNTQQMSASEFNRSVVEQAPAGTPPGSMLWVNLRPPEERSRPSAIAPLEVLTPIASTADDGSTPHPPLGLMKRIALALGLGERAATK